MKEKKKSKEKVYKPPKPLITYKGISYTIEDVPKTKKDWFKKNIKKLGNNNEIQKWMGHLVVHNITHLNKMLALMKKGNSFDKAHKLAIK